jgi:hypothetical protein
LGFGASIFVVLLASVYYQRPSLLYQERSLLGLDLGRIVRQQTPPEPQDIDPSVLFSHPATYNRYNYKVCHSSDTCVNSSHVILLSASDDEAKANAAAAARCCGPAGEALLPVCHRWSPEFCQCFNQHSQVAFVSKATVQDIPFRKEEGYLIDQWKDNGHNPAHFAMMAVLFHSVVLHRKHYRLPDVPTIVWQDLQPPKTSFESDIWDITLKGLPFKVKEELYAMDPEQKVPICFRSLHYANQPAIYTTSEADMQAFRSVAESVYGFPRVTAAKTFCPSTRVGLLVRTDGNRLRRMANQDEVLRFMKGKGLEVEVFETTGAMTGKEQAERFNRFGLLLSSHSSQLANLIFAQENAAVIEVSSILRDNLAVFHRLGRKVGLFYINSAGHRPTNPVAVEHFDRVGQMPGCNFTLEGETLEHLCLDKMEAYGKSANQGSDYVVDLNIFGQHLQTALDHLDSVCSGRWQRGQQEEIPAGIA